MMKPTRDSHRPQPDAWDHLWALLPVFIAFLALLVIFADNVGP